ncbi:MAG: DUF167 family protein [Gammaproteobacteria bacterium]|nr:DUF167 family protein [Gammaproteobacteria bacterium]
MTNFYQWQDDGLVLNIKVQPKASRDELAEIMGEYLKVRITAPPVDGKANQHLIHFLAKIFKVAKSDIELLSGETGRLKRIKVLSPRQLPACIKKPNLARSI